MSALLLSCRDCGAIQSPPAVATYDVLLCAACDCELERHKGRTPIAALAFAMTTFILLFPANLFPFLTTSILGASRQSYLVSSAAVMWRRDWPGLAIAIGLFLIVLPFLRFALLSIVLACVIRRVKAPWLGRAFRWANNLQNWAMLDVFLLALWVAHARLSATVHTELRTGAYCFIAAAIVSVITRATLDKEDIWRRIMSPERGTERRGDLGACPACELVTRHLPGDSCPRCGATLDRRIPAAIPASVALTLTGVLLYIPANLYPIARIPIGLTPTSYTILGGVLDLVDAHLIGLAVLVFVASFAIPFIKLIGIGWCITSVMRGSTFALSTKTKTYRVVEEIGRWSMVDPFVVGCFVPVTQFNAAISSGIGPAAPFFTAVVILTMLAAHVFDPRLMWDAARGSA